MYNISIDRLKMLLCCIFCASTLFVASSALSAVNWLYSSISSSNSNSTMAKVGDTVTFTFTTSAPINTPTVTVKSGGVTVAGAVTKVNTSGNTWNASYITASSDTEGTVQFAITAEDGSGGSSQLVGTTTDFSSVTFDKSAPFISQVAAVPAQTTDNTPNYRFSSFEAGTILYGGDCTSTQTNAFGGTTTVTFSTLADGLHSNCTIRVRDAAGNVSNTLTVPAFTVDATAPVLTEVTPVVSPIAGLVASYTFNATQAGTISYGGSCSSTTTAAVIGDNTIQFLMPPNPPFTNGVLYDDCTITVTDAGGHASNILSVTSFIVDTTTPYAYEVTPIASPVADATPTYVFSVDEAGTITYGGSCASLTTSASAGENTITFNTLADGTYDDCTITITDAAGNSSEPVLVTSFTVAAPVPVARFVISNPADTVVRRSVVISIQVLKADDTVDTSYQQDVTLLVSGAATGAGLVDIVNGIGTITITDTVAETVLLVLSDTEGTGLDVSSTQDVIFRQAGGTQTPPTLVQFSGRAYPDARITIVTKDKDQLEDVLLQSDIISNKSGVFAVTFNEPPLKTLKTYGIAFSDAHGQQAPTKFFNIEIKPEKTITRTIFAPPTLSIADDVVSMKENVRAEGYATPGSVIEFELDGEVLELQPSYESGGLYYVSLAAGDMTPGTHTLRVRQIDADGIASDYSLTHVFTITTFAPETDLNGDGAVTINDWSIFLLNWGSDDAARHTSIDFNHDGSVTISDLSIFIQTMR